MIQKVPYLRGWPHGKATIFDRFLNAPASAENDEGSAVSWEISPTADEAHKVLRANGEPKTLFELSEGGSVLLVNCKQN